MLIIDPLTINPRTLPSVSLEERAALPTVPCVYFALDKEGKVQYIGRSNNLRKRWQAHHRGVDLALLGGVCIAYLESDVSLLLEIERALIACFRPPLNQIIGDKPDLEFSRKNRRRGDGTGRIHWRKVIKKNGKEYKQAWYDWQIHQGGKTVYKSKYIPKRLLAKIQELELAKAPVKEILKLLGKS